MEDVRMSVKAQALVWDLECPKQYGEIAFKPSHKYTLIAYADHADHAGKNIYPAIPTIAKKTGLDERTIQRLTHDMEEIGLLIEDGVGPKGTNRWRLPYSDGGDKLSPASKCQGDKSDQSLGDIPSGDNPSGDNLTPELKEPEPIYKDIWEKILQSLQSQMSRAVFESRVKTCRLYSIEEGIVTIEARDEEDREWLQERLSQTIRQLFVGIMSRDMHIRFVILVKDAAL